MAPVIRMELRHRVEHRDGGTTHAIDLTGVPTIVAGPRTLFWTARGQPDLAAPPVLDSFVVAVALQLSRAGGELRVRGPMSRSGLFNVVRLLELRRATSPGRYQPLKVIPDDVVDVAPSPTGDRSAVLAFSGGVDSAHAAVRHAHEPRSDDSLDLKALVMVLGFEAGLDQQDVFDRMLARARPLSADLGIPLVAVETNSKLLVRDLWPQTATPLAAAALAMFWQTARHGIFGGGLPYGANFLPLGHQPLFDQCCSGDTFTLVTDAAGLSRKQKLINLAARPVALTGLRVCWKGSDVSKNCGRCAKCIQTMMNMRMAGLDFEAAFEVPFEINRIHETAPHTLYDVRDLAEYCWTDMKDDPEMAIEAQAVREVLAAIPPPSVILKTGSAAATLLPTASTVEVTRTLARRGLKLAKQIKGAARRRLQAIH